MQAEKLLNTRSTEKKITATYGIHSDGYVLWILGSVGQNMLT
jgi:hypothetical protein